MKFSFTGKNITVTEDMRSRAEQKIGRLARLLPEDAEAFVAIIHEKPNIVAEVTIPLNKRQARAKFVAVEWQTAVDGVVDALERQIVKYKQRLKSKSRHDHAFKEELNFFAATHTGVDGVDENSDSAVHIVKTKRFALKPMDAEEAVMEMEMLGHDFFVFRNAANDDVNVVYKRGDGKYGLIEPNAQ